MAECKSLMTMKDSRKTVTALIACYYTFNIQYPKEVRNTPLYIEKYLLGISAGQRMTAAATQAISAIDINLKSRHCKYTLNIMYSYITS